MSISTLDAVMEIEGNDSITEERWIECFQSLIDSGDVWDFQGWYGRTARNLIAAGICTQ